MSRQTPLFELHQQTGARLVDFAGWQMPIQYTSIPAEHHCVRSAVGIFDVSHMGRVFLSGNGVIEMLERLVVSRVHDLTPGKTRYSVVCNPQGGTKDDVLITCLAADCFLVVVNASNREKLLPWFTEHQPSTVRLEDRTMQTGMVAVQGPTSLELMQKLLQMDLHALPYYHAMMMEKDWIVLRTGYTGETGFEIIAPAADMISIWKQTLSLGAQPIGLGARDTLRLEMGFSLYGHELTEEISPLEAGIGWVVHFDKPDFIGKSVLEQQKREGLPRTRIGFVMEDSGIPRQGYTLFEGEKAIGVVTSGGFSPTLNKGIGLGLVNRGYEFPQELFVEIRNKKTRAKAAKPPFVEKRVKM